MKTKKSGIVMLVAFVSVLGLGQTASAGPCDTEIKELRTALEKGYCNYGKRKRCKRLNRKLDRVVRKLEKGKYRKATRKLSNFGQVVENMAMRRKPRMAMTDFKDMVGPYTQVSDSIARVAGGGSDTPTDPVTPTTEEPPVAPDAPTVAF